MARPFDPRQFDEEVLKANGVFASFGVPDSSLSGLLSYFSSEKFIPNHIVTANEGGAVALAAGYYLSTRRVAMVYMQNSGLANALNPLQSLAVKEVFGLPMLLIIGWRGKPGEKDEPQHALIGLRVLNNLEANDIPYEEIPNTLMGAKETVARLIARSKEDQTPVALIIPQKTFLDYESNEVLQNMTVATPARHETLVRCKSSATTLPLSRESAIRCLIEHVATSDIVVSSLGGNSRELYMIRKERGDPVGKDFFAIGAMGHTYALAHGIKIGSPSHRVFCIDGDGSFLMHVGNNAVLSSVLTTDVIHIVIYNGSHSSTGRHPLSVRKEHFMTLAGSLGYRLKFLVQDKDGLRKACEAAIESTLIIIAVNDFVRQDLPRPSESPKFLKNVFMSSFE